MRFMIKRSLMILGLCLALTGCNEEKKTNSGNDVTTQAVLVVNPEKIYKESKVAKAGIDHLNSLGQNFQNELFKLEALTKNGTNQEQGQKLFDEKYMKMQQSYADEQEQVTTKITDIFNSAVEKTRKDLHAKIIISTELVVAMDSATTDVTEAIIKEMDKSTISFESNDHKKVNNVGLNATKVSKNATNHSKK